MAEEKPQAKGAFWGTLIGAVVVSLLSSGALSSFLTAGSEDKAKEVAKTEVAEVETAIAKYIKEEVEPKILDAFAGVDEDLEALDEELAKCQGDLRETTVVADTALRIASRGLGRRHVEREMRRDQPPPPAPTSVRGDKRTAPKFNPYEQRAQAPDPPPFAPPPMGD